MHKFHIKTFGCQMNEYDSDLIKGLLINKGYSSVETIETADYIIINTCTVRDKADHKVYSFLGGLKNMKKTIGVVGCMAEKDGKEVIKRVPYVNFVVGPRRIKEIPEIIERLNKGEKHIVCVGENKLKTKGRLPITNNRIPALNNYVTIMQGCSNYCSYCIVPYVRGEEKSKKADEILMEIKNLVENEVSEITLLGQNVNSYGKNFSNGGTDFVGLLKEVVKTENLQKIKFMTSHPKDISMDLINFIAKEQKMDKRIHLPVQSGSNRILKLMNRGYTREKYLEIIKEIRDNIPEVSITTDVIVGFPGETENDFEDTLDLVRKAKFDAAFTFKYSSRKGTPASAMAGEIDKQIKEERLKKVMEVIEESKK